MFPVKVRTQQAHLPPASLIKVPLTCKYHDVESSRRHSSRLHRSSTRFTSGWRHSSSHSHTKSHKQESNPIKEATKALEQQYSRIGGQTGKGISSLSLTLQPYRCLPSDLKRNAGVHLSRHDLSLPEHICGPLCVLVGVRI